MSKQRIKTQISGIIICLSLVYFCDSTASESPTTTLTTKPRHDSASSHASTLAPSPAAPPFVEASSPKNTVTLAHNLLTPRFLASLAPLSEDDVSPFALDPTATRVVDRPSDWSLLASRAPTAATLPAPVTCSPPLSNAASLASVLADGTTARRRSRGLSIDATTTGTEGYTSDGDTEMAAPVTCALDPSVQAAMANYQSTTEQPFADNVPVYPVIPPTVNPDCNCSECRLTVMPECKYNRTAENFALLTEHAWLDQHLSVSHCSPTELTGFTAQSPAHKRWRPTLPDILEAPSAANPYGPRSSPSFESTWSATGPLTRFLADHTDPSYASAGYRCLPSPRTPPTPRELTAHQLACSTVHTALYHALAKPKSPSPTSTLAGAGSTHLALPGPTDTRKHHRTDLHSASAKSLATTIPIAMPVPLAYSFPRMPDCLLFATADSVSSRSAPTGRTNIDGADHASDNSGDAAAAAPARAPVPLYPFYDPAKLTLYEQRYEIRLRHAQAQTHDAAAAPASDLPKKIAALVLTDLDRSAGWKAGSRTPRGGRVHQYTTASVALSRQSAVSFRE